MKKGKKGAAKKTEAFDWYVRHSDLKEILANYLKPQYKFLHVGCGTSSNFVLHKKKNLPRNYWKLVVIKCLI